MRGVSGFCQCPTPKRRANGVGRVVCVNQSCHKEIRGRGEKNGDILPEDLQAIQDRINRLKSSVMSYCDELSAQLQDLKKQS
jgi:hypothetical protein